ncbi:putative ribonucleoside-diphosphate reductase small chain B [Panus rudis PR-1116 ss-1]|nr:putative ribonucleoside-diphosphate reductase small chain B [Panus rudis PR-1116 ss-1]
MAIQIDSSTPRFKCGLVELSEDRFMMYPTRDSTLWSFYKTAQSTIWLPEEVDLTEDLHQWKNSLSDTEHLFLGKVLAFFAGSDGIVAENLVVRFYGDVHVPEARAFYSFQMAIEQVHSETYALLLTTLITNDRERADLFKGIVTVPTIAAKAQWAFKWMDPSSQPFSARLVAFAAVEGIFFSSSFAAIFWLRSRGLMPGLCHSNDLISRDEALHTNFACYLHSLLLEPCSSDTITAIVREAVELEKAFFRDALAVSLVGLSPGSMGIYIEVVADFLLRKLGCAPLYGSKNPFPFMDMILMEGKNNFFERKVSEYHSAAGNIAFAGSSDSSTALRAADTMFDDLDLF